MEKSYILDWTQNIKMSKEDYIKLYKFKILQKISCKDLIKDREILNKAEYQDLKTYLVFRDEIMRDFDRNKHLFKESRVIIIFNHCCFFLNCSCIVFNCVFC